MNYDAIVEAFERGDQSPALVTAAFLCGEKQMALHIARGTSWGNPTGVALPMVRRAIMAEYSVHGEGGGYVGTFSVDQVLGTDLCLVVDAPIGAQYSDDRLTRLVEVAA